MELTEQVAGDFDAHDFAAPPLEAGLDAQLGSPQLMGDDDLDGDGMPG